MAKDDRRFVLYGVGAAKSGTATLADVFAWSYRSGHEPESERFVPLLCDVLEGRASRSKLRREVRRRDRRLRLEVDAAGFNGAIVGELVELHPDAWFALTVRHPVDWLRSITNHVLARTPVPHWKRLRDLTFGDPRWGGFGPGEEPLQEAGLYPLDGYLGQWADRTRTVLGTVPHDRLVVIRTERFAEGVNELAGRLGIGVSTLDLDSHRNPTAKDFGVVEQLDPALVAAKVEQHCGDLLPRLGLD
ncbi:MAG TPA: sulfotransferase [Acidimicrobiales bacterium]|nr:sulfotransferase [Acidimicrobiales bacterium]